MTHFSEPSNIQDDANAVAIIGLACRFPGASDAHQFWNNMKNGIESIQHYSDEQLRAAGVDEALLANKDYVKASGALSDPGMFDADFFNVTARDAALMDPQHRLFMEVMWEALENAGYAARAGSSLVGIYAGASSNTYFLENIMPNGELMRSAGVMQLAIGNEKDFLCSKVAHHMDLHGPAVVVQTACSTSLVAVHLACQSILNGECDMAMAGGVSVNLVPGQGYVYIEGGIASPDGHCRAFDAQAAGTVPGNGAGAVVLKRLQDALHDGDTIQAVIRGSAINNDGADKTSYTAPSINQQAVVIAEAHGAAGIEAHQVSYIETHGTGTVLGDPVEIEALKLAFGQAGALANPCAIGSVKSNIGHLDAAAGVAGLIKAVLALKHKEIPPSLHYQRANPFIDFSSSPFRVNAALSPWLPCSERRIAGVSSFGIGGTNAHLVVEEAPAINSPASARLEHLLCLSARNLAALNQKTSELREFFVAHPETSLADAAYTLQLGRTEFEQRRVIRCDSVAGLEAHIDAGVFESDTAVGKSGPELVFMFPGQGSQYVGMGKELYLTEPVFKQEVDRCAGHLRPWIGCDLREILFPAEGAREAAASRLNETQITQPALFVIEYALARQFMAWGVNPRAMVGHSLGEYVAACLASVFSLPDALMLVAERGRLMASMAPGCMIAVHASAEQLESLLNNDIAIAAVNAPSECTASGNAAAIESLKALLDSEGIKFQPLSTSHAFHSPMMTQMLDAFAARLRSVSLHSPQTAWLSNVSGTWITDEQATSVAYWVEQVCAPVRFADCIATALNEGSRVYLEVGPGRALSNLVKRQANAGTTPTCTSLIDSTKPYAAGANALLGRLWLHGVKVDWASYWGGEQRRRIALPTYPFQRKLHWIDKLAPADAGARRPGAQFQRRDVAQWLYAPGWKRLPQQHNSAACDRVPAGVHLVFIGRDQHGFELLADLQAAGANAIVVTPGAVFSSSHGHYTMDPACADHYAQLVETAISTDGPIAITYLSAIGTAGAGAVPGAADDFHSLLFLAKALGAREHASPVALDVVVNGLFSVTGAEALLIGKSTVLGACKVIPIEYPNVTCRCIDIELDAAVSVSVAVRQMYLADLMQAPASAIVAYRGTSRWVQTFEPVPADPLNVPVAFKENGHYLITGGLGAIGYSFAEFIAQHASSPQITIIGRSALPERGQWDALRHDGSATARKIVLIDALDASGAQVQYLNADVADAEQMGSIAELACGAFGPVHGIFHAAGIGGDSIIQHKTEALARAVLAPKVAGTLLLDQLFDGAGLDFFVLCSSVSAIAPIFGQVDYCAANAFLDAFATERRARGANVTAINWGALHEVGMASKLKTGVRAPDATAVTSANAFSSADVAAVYAAALSLSLAQMIVSPIDFDLVLKGIHGVNSALADSAKRASLPAATGSRPDMATQFVAPQSDIESGMAGIWQGLFGISSIGINDNFFDLGGHSLLAARLVADLSNAYQVNLPLSAFFAAPTIAGMSAYIEDLIIQEIEQLTDEEVISHQAI